MLGGIWYISFLYACIGLRTGICFWRRLCRERRLCPLSGGCDLPSSASQAISIKPALSRNAFRWLHHRGDVSPGCVGRAWFCCSWRALPLLGRCHGGAFLGCPASSKHSAEFGRCVCRCCMMGFSASGLERCWYLTQVLKSNNMKNLYCLWELTVLDWFIWLCKIICTGRLE